MPHGLIHPPDSQGLWDQGLETGESFLPLLTSDGAAPIVPRNPGQGDGRGRGFGDSEAGLVWGNCEGKTPALSGKGMECPNRKVLALPHPLCTLPFSPQFPQGLPTPPTARVGFLCRSVSLTGCDSCPCQALKPPALQSLTLYQKVDDDGVKATGVGGRAGVIAGVFRLHSTKQQCTVCVDEPVSIQGHGDCGVFTARPGGGMG